MDQVRERIIYYCDETSHIDDEFMAVGGIAINLNALPKIEEQILEVRREMNVREGAEIKWSNVKARRDNAHKSYASLLHSLVKEGRAHFHIRFQRLEDWNHEMSGPRRKTDTVSRAYYQLVLHRPVGYYGKKADIHIRPDKGECTERLPEFIGHLNTEARKKKNCIVPVVKTIEPRDSKLTPGLQLLDVTLGGLASIRNGRHLREGGSKVKRDLAEHIHELWGGLDLAKSTPKNIREFSVWNAKPILR